MKRNKIHNLLIILQGFGENPTPFRISNGIVFIQMVFFVDQTSGATDDWAKSIGVKYAFNPELRGGWFVVDESEIQLSGEEIFNGIKAMAKAIKTREKF